MLMLIEPFTSPAFWICPVCASGAAERVESCRGFIDIPDHELGETELVDATHEIVYRPEYVERLTARAVRAEEERDAMRVALLEIRDKSEHDSAGFRRATLRSIHHIARAFGGASGRS
jgi:hypothetical protein